MRKKKSGIAIGGKEKSGYDIGGNDDGKSWLVSYFASFSSTL